MRKVLAYILACAVVFVAIMAKVPTSHCHCKDPQKQTQSECPFAKLRLLTSVIVPTPVLFERTFVTSLLIDYAGEAELIEPCKRDEHPGALCQGPPASSFIR